MAAEGSSPRPRARSTPRVNGAAAGWPRKVGLAVAEGGGRLVASMGPRPDGRGRFLPFRYPECAWGVNGAAAGWPRKGRPPAPTACPAPSVNGAAAGWPRKAGRLPRRTARLFASMGPRPDGRGRDHAEFLCDAQAVRQWGRGRMAAEGLAARHAVKKELQASMGPRPDGRGRINPRMQRRFNEGVNGAAAGWPRKVPYSGRLYRGQTCVNGAAAGWPRKAEAPALSTRLASSVNGAAAGWPRKGSQSSSRTAATTRRQWGRGRMAAEGR